MNRYYRHISLSEIGLSGQAKLEKSRVLIIGAGGLGCPALQYLTAAGVGKIGIVDFDSVDITNLQRQILYGTSSLGVNKAEAAKARLQDLNDTIEIIAYPVRLTQTNVLHLIAEYDVIVDGTDNFATRYLINDACAYTNKPLVFGAIYKFEGQVSVFNYLDGSSYRCLFPEDTAKQEGINCAEIGVLGVLPGIIGTLQASEVLKILLGIGNVLSGKVLCFDALTLKTMILKIKKSPIEVAKSKANAAAFINNQQPDQIEKATITAIDAFKLPTIQWVDVREKGEQPLVKGLDYINIPLSQLDKSIALLDTHKTIVFFCLSGKRSKIAVKLAQQLGLNTSKSLVEGATQLNEIINQSKKKNTND